MSKSTDEVIGLLLDAIDISDDYTLIESVNNTFSIISTFENSEGVKEVFTITVKPARLTIIEKEE